MLKATIAACRVELIGCDAMPCAQFFPLFPQTAGDAHFTVEVTVQDSLPLPIGKPFERIGPWRIVREDAGDRSFCHQNGSLMLTADEPFTQVHLYLHKDLPARDVIHYQQVKQVFSYYLQHHGGCLLHGAGLSLDGDGILLCGKSGVGKSTMVRRLTAYHPTAKVLCEESTALTEDASGMMLHGTPFCGQDTLCAQECAQLRAVVFLRQASHDRVCAISKEEALFELLSAIPRPSFEEQVCAMALERLVRVIEKTPMLCFENTGSAESAQVLTASLTEWGLWQKKDR